MDARCDLAIKLYQAYKTTNVKFIKDTVSNYRSDDFFYPICQFYLFKLGKIKTDDFVSAFPDNRDKYNRFFNGPWGCNSTSEKALYKESLVDPLSFYDELVKLMKKNNRMAIDRVMRSVPWMDGVIAEDLLWEKLPKFINDHPDIILKNWDLFRYRIQRVDSDVLTEEVYQSLVRTKKKVQKIQGDSVSKTEFLRYLDKQLNEHKTYK